MVYFDPSEYVRGLQQLLVSDKKRIGFLFGAGTSLAKKNDDSITVPAVKEMTKKIMDYLRDMPEYRSAVEEIEKEIDPSLFTVEAFLSNIETKLSVIGKSTLNGLDQQGFAEIIEHTKQCIIGMVNVHKKISYETRTDMIHYDFAQWIGRANRKYPVEIFTTNYDYLFELGMEYNAVPYYDGFSGSYRPFFCADSVENLSFLTQQTKLWKLHGSHGWTTDKDSSRVVRGFESEDALLIYPSMLKYEDSRKQPYTALMDRLTNFIRQPDSVLFACGYSFQDQHINERIITALQTDSTAHVYALYYDKYWEEEQKKYLLTPNSHLVDLARRNSKLSIFGCRNAVIGCQYGEWKLKSEPSKEDTLDVNYYFDEDAPEESIGDHGSSLTWTGAGEMVLPDFAKLVEFLRSMIIVN